MFQQIIKASERLSGFSHKTPILTSSTLNNFIGTEVFFKCENFQRIGAFKFRGAFNCISQLSKKEKTQGVIAFSSGNHAQAVALVGKLLGIKTTIVMPNNSPKVKLDATKGYGANIVLYDTETENREVITQKLQDKFGYSLIAPFDDKYVIAGQGTVAYEFLNKVPDLDTLLVPCGGGGLLSGSAIATKHLNPNCQVIGIEPELADDAKQSFKSGKIVTIPVSKTIADGTRTTSLGRLTFPLIQQYVDNITTTSEKAIIDAVKFHLLRMKIVVEPSGALGLAALLSKAVKAQGKIGVIISGGNIDPSTLIEVLKNNQQKTNKY